MKNQKLYTIKKLKIYIEHIVNFLLNLVIKEKFNKSKYKFSIRKVWLRGLDLNQGPSGYEPDELPDCSTPR